MRHNKHRLGLTICAVLLLALFSAITPASARPPQRVNAAVITYIDDEYAEVTIPHGSLCPSVDLIGHDIMICFVGARIVIDDVELYGINFPDAQLILVNSQMPAAAQRDTVWHELQHMALALMGGAALSDLLLEADADTCEELVIRLKETSDLYMLRRNKWLRRWLIDEVALEFLRHKHKLPVYRNESD